MSKTTMSFVDIPPSLFSEHAEKVKRRISLLDHFSLPERNHWPLDWDTIRSITSVQNRNNWHQLPVFKHLLLNKQMPAVYLFTISEENARDFYELFLRKSTASSEARIQKGVGSQDFCNLSHIPKDFTSSQCVYVGSRKKNVHERFRQHLGYWSARTGALHLARVFASEQTIPEITFHYYILDPRYTEVTEEIESVVQQANNPIIGKKLLND